jgi:hypothetical protein
MDSLFYTQALMDGSSSTDGNHGNAESFINKLRETKTGLSGIAKLEKMRAEEAMKDLKEPFIQAHIFGP